MTGDMLFICLALCLVGSAMLMESGLDDCIACIASHLAVYKSHRE